jgi:hypothetical protein
VILAVSIFLLILVVGLAVDGGAVYNQRRVAQNSADAAALAGTKVMLDAYDQMILDYSYDVDGTAADEVAISSTITAYANLHGVQRSNLQAFYINDDKQLVTDAEVGSYGGVPWTLGAKGIAVKNRSETDSFFMKMIGWTKVGSSASATAFMGIAVDSGVGLPLAPIGFFTATENIPNLTVGQTYTLMTSNQNYGPGNWGWVNFSGNASASVLSGWLNCGYNPALTTSDQWEDWCTTDSNARGEGPTEHFQCADHPDCTAPLEDPVHVPYLKWGFGDEGWWLGGSTGTKSSDCRRLTDYVHENQEYYVPIFDLWQDNGSNSRFHLAEIGKFIITTVDVDCHPDPQQEDHWHIDGTFERFFVPGSGGRHGDLRHTSGHTVFPGGE